MSVRCCERFDGSNSSSGGIKTAANDAKYGSLEQGIAELVHVQPIPSFCECSGSSITTNHSRQASQKRQSSVRQTPFFFLNIFFLAKILVRRPPDLPDLLWRHCVKHSKSDIHKKAISLERQPTRTINEILRSTPIGRAIACASSEEKDRVSRLFEVAYMISREEMPFTNIFAKKNIF